jgi:hypothetical protein
MYNIFTFEELLGEKWAIIILYSLKQPNFNMKNMVIWEKRLNFAPDKE